MHNVLFSLKKKSYPIHLNGSVVKAGANEAIPQILLGIEERIDLVRLSLPAARQ